MHCKMNGADPPRAKERAPGLVIITGAFNTQRDGSYHRSGSRQVSGWKYPPQAWWFELPGKDGPHMVNVADLTTWQQAYG